MALVPLNPSQLPIALMGFCFERLPIHVSLLMLIALLMTLYELTRAFYGTESFSTMNLPKTVSHLDASYFHNAKLADSH
jgi:hypothetical protein